MSLDRGMYHYDPKWSQVPGDLGSIGARESIAEDFAEVNVSLRSFPSLLTSPHYLMQHPDMTTRLCVLE
jgi:hypothetical protein